MSSTTVFLVVAALLLAATPADALPFRFPGRFRGRGWWWRPAAPTTPPTPSDQHCTCAGAGGGGARSAAAGAAAAAAADVPEPFDCVTPLAGMMTCGEYLTGSTQAPGSGCCAELAAFVGSATAAGGGGDSQLKCLCPVIRGEINDRLPKPVDPLRMIFLPRACGVVVPPQVVPLCLNASSRFVTATRP